MQKIFVFDIDDTVLYPDHAHDKQTLYCEPKYLRSNPVLILLIRDLIAAGHTLYFITARHPTTQAQLLMELIFAIDKPIDLDQVICRPFKLSKEERTLIVQNKDAESLFLTEIVDWKSGLLRNLAQTAHVYFFDDMRADYLQKFAYQNRVRIMDLEYENRYLYCTTHAGIRKKYNVFVASPEMV